MEYYTLANGVQMPKIGIGTYKISETEARDVVYNAIHLGYRHIDTATFYENESAIGEAILASEVPREELFVTTKVWTTANSYDKTIESVEQSLKKLRTPYLDLVLIHWPKPEMQEMWRALEDMYDSGLIRAIGVSNFKQHHIDELLETARIAPMIDQVELHPYFQQGALRDYCMSKNIQVEAWSPLLRGGLFFDTTLTALENKYCRSIAQIVLRFLVKEGISVIPKSVSPVRMAENLDIFSFDIEDEDVARLRALNKNIRYYRDPDRHGF